MTTLKEILLDPCEHRQPYSKECSEEFCKSHNFEQLAKGKMHLLDHGILGWEVLTNEDGEFFYYHSGTKFLNDKFRELLKTI